MSIFIVLVAICLFLVLMGHGSDLVYMVGAILILGLISIVSNIISLFFPKTNLVVKSDYVKNKYKDETYSDYVKRKKGS